MQTRYPDYSNHLGLRLCHELYRIEHALPFPGMGRIMRLLRRIMPKPRPDGLCIIKTIHGFKVMVDPILDKGVERAVFNNGTYEEGTLRIMNHVLKDHAFFMDIGSNIGLMSLHAAKILKGNGNVLSFEPLPGTYDLLCRNIKLNDFARVKALNMAIGSAEGTVDIFENLAVNRGSASLMRPERQESSYKIPIRRVDDYLKENGIGREIACIKIDVEGWELEVLKGARRTLSGPDAPVCIVECTVLHPTYGGDRQSIYTFLRQVNSYRIFRLLRGKEHPSRLTEVEGIGHLPEHDNLFCFLPRHIQKLPRRLFV